MRLLAASDLHCDLDACAALVAAAAEADLVICAGDFARGHRGLEPVMAALEPIAAKAIHVPGNNETETALRAATTATVLHGEATRRGGLTIVGLGAGIPPLPHAPFASFDLTEAQAAAALGGFDRADILILHSPPKGTADRLASGESIGSTALRDAIVRIQPQLALCGHVHDSWGRSGRIGATRVQNLGPGLSWFEIP